jgi:phage I-like protein
MTARLQDVFLFDLGALACEVVVESPIESEIQLCRTGAFYRADMGHFKVTRSTLEKMVQNAIERGVDIPINYYHKGGDHNAPNSERKAAGWVRPASLLIRGYKGGFGLFGVARWTAEAAQKIKAEELRYISPEIVWADVRMAATEAGPAGEPIGASLTGAALVNDPFFNLNPVVFSWRGAPGNGAPKRYYMLNDTRKANIEKLLKGAGVPAEALAGLLAQITLEVMASYKEESESPVMATEEVKVEEAMPAAAATPTEANAQAQALAASREGQAALARRVAQLESEAIQRKADEGAALFERYKKEGRFRVYAEAANDPTGEKKAKEHMGKGVAFFRAVFDAVPPLTGARPPAFEGAAPAINREGPSGTAFAGSDKGMALHQRVVAEIRAKNLDPKKDYNRIAAQFARNS